LPRSDFAEDSSNKFYNKEYYDPILDDPRNDSCVSTHGRFSELSELDFGDVQDNIFKSVWQPELTVYGLFMVIFSSETEYTINYPFEKSP